MKAINWVIYILLFSIFSGCEENKIDIERFGSLSGLVLNGEDYSPLQGVLISTNPSSTTVLTDSMGRFSLDKVGTGEVTINSRKPNFLSSTVSVAIYDGEKTELTVFLLEDQNNVGSVIIYEPVPGNGAVDQKTSFSFQWGVDRENTSRQIEYNVYYFEAGSTVQQLAGENLRTREVVVDDLKYATTYYWYVVAKYEGSRVAYSPTWSFKTEMQGK